MLKQRKKQLVLSAFLAGIVFYVPAASAQTAPTDLTIPFNGATPETDNDFNGVDDSEQNDGGTSAQPVFDTAEDDEPSDPANSDFPTDQLTNNPANRRVTDDDTTGRANTRALSTQQVGIIGTDGSVTPLANTPAVPVQGGATASTESPYAPLGIRLGMFTLFPTLTQTIGTTSNADFSENGSESTFSQTDVRAVLVSDWALHQLRAELGGSYQTFFNGTSEDLPTFDANMELRLDHSYNITTTFGGAYNLSTESAVSDNLTVPAGVFILERPNVHRFSGFAEFAKTTGRLNTSLRGTITHSVYEGTDLSNGGRLPQGDRTNTLYELRGRLGYRTSETFQPFVEAAFGTRQYQYKFDRNGNQRDSNVYALRGGFTFNRGEKLSGELAVGYSTEDFVDSAITDLSGATIDGTINWSPQRFTTVSLNAQTSFTGSTNVNEAGSITYATTLGVVHDLRPDLSLNTSVLASIRDYDGSGRQDQTLQLRAGAEWRLNRTVSVIGNLGYETVDSTEAGSSYDAATVSLGLRLQR